MTVNRYKIGKFIIKIITPVQPESDRQYDSFLTDENREDFTAEFETVPSIEAELDDPLYKTDVATCMKINGEYHTFYGGNYGGKIYAERISYPGGCKVRLSEEYSDKLFNRTVFSVIGIEEIAAMNDAVVFHSSVIAVNGKAVLFTGPCGIGKSTQADLWAKYRNAEIINGDKSLIYMDGDIPTVSGLPYAGSSKFCENRQLPIKAIVNLSQAEYNITENISGVKAFSAIFRSSYPASNFRELKNRQADVIEKISSGVKVINFSCLPDESAVKCLEEEIC